MAINTARVTFDSLSEGDELPPFEIGETQETINSARVSISDDEEVPPNIHTDPEFAKAGLFAGTVNAGVTTMAYVTQMLEQWFPASAFYNGGRLNFKAIEPFRPGDTVTFTGKVTGKRLEGGKKFVDCEIQGVNQHGRVACVAEATLALDE
ncbi:MAG: MaoC family dehydratase [Chloroflexi bacterium]|nr:MaoC family dehydratase [Chloroflexota bacterium]